MNKVDMLIDDLCDYIEKRMDSIDANTAEDVAKNTKALAELVAARAQENASVEFTVDRAPYSREYHLIPKQHCRGL